jgi:hypothetical protein
MAKSAFESSRPAPPVKQSFPIYVPVRVHRIRCRRQLIHYLARSASPQGHEPQRGSSLGIHSGKEKVATIRRPQGPFFAISSPLREALRLWLPCGVGYPDAALHQRPANRFVTSEIGAILRGHER